MVKCSSCCNIWNISYLFNMWISLSLIWYFTWAVLVRICPKAHQSCPWFFHLHLFHQENWIVSPGTFCSLGRTRRECLDIYRSYPFSAFCFATGGYYERKRTQTFSYFILGLRLHIHRFSLHSFGCKSILNQWWL